VHLLRDLEDAAQTYPDAIWPGQIADALRGLIHAANLARGQGLAAVPGDMTAEHLKLFRRGVTVGLSEVRRVPGAKSKQPPARTLLECLRHREADVLRFLTGTAIPPTSNQAERDLRPSKTQQKISGHYNLSISTSDQMIAHKFRGRLDRAAIIDEMTAAVAVARAAGAETIGVNAEDGSRTDDGYLLEFALAARDAGATRIRYCDTIGGDSPGRIRERFAKLAAAAGLPVETHCHNDLGMAVANSVSGALGDLDAGQDAWVNTCVNGIGERAGNTDLLSCILAFRHGFGVAGTAAIGDPIDESWARRFGLWAAYAFGQPLPPAWPGTGRNAFAHESGIHADGALKDRGNYELYDDSALGPFPSDWYARDGRVVLTGEYAARPGSGTSLPGSGSPWRTARRTWCSPWCSCARPRPASR